MRILGNRISLLILFSILVLGVDMEKIHAKEANETNHLNVGTVNIEIGEFTLNAKGEEVPWIDGIGILPGMKVSKIPYFTATGNDCYIRATVKVEEDVKAPQPITVDSLKGISEDWIRIGDYFYYKYPLKTGQSVDFFHSFIVPSEWDDRINPASIGDWGLALRVVVDAIQAENITPDFESDNPWGNITIQENVQKDKYDVNVFTKDELSDQMSNPDTGDKKSSMAVLTAIVVVSGGTVSLLLRRKKRRKYDTESNG